MGQEYYLMKTFKIAAATAVLALASGYAGAAGNTASTAANTDPSAKYHLSSPIAITGTSNLLFPDLVISAGASVAVSASGSAIYGTDSSPAGGSAGASNSAGNTRYGFSEAALGSVTVTGEEGYQFSTTAAFTDNSGLTLKLYGFDSAGTISTTEISSGSPLGNAIIAGPTTVSFGGILSVNTPAAPAVLPTAGNGSVDLTITVAYN